MAGEDDMDSLFAGMDLVNPLDDGAPSFSQPSPSPSLVLNVASDNSLHPNNSSFHNSETKPAESDITKVGSINSILAAYENASAKAQQPSLQKQSSDSSKHVVRRKRRSVKIGYGRSAADDADEIRSSASGQDETASNGSAMDEHILSLPDLVSAPGHDEVLSLGYKESMSSSTTSIYDNVSLSVDAIDSKPEHPFENLTVFVERLESQDATVLTPEGHTSHVSGSVQRSSSTKNSDIDIDTEVVQSREVDSNTVNASKGENVTGDLSELQAVTSDEASIENSKEHCAGISSSDTPSSAEPSDFGSEENQSNQFKLQIKIPPNLSMEERFLNLKVAVANNIDLIHAKIAAVSQARKEAAQKRRHLAGKVSQTSMRFREVEEEIQAACEKEDFETAEQLDEALARAQEAKQAAIDEFSAAELEYDNCSSKMHEVVELLITTEEEGFSLFEQLEQDAAEKAGHLAKKHEDEMKMKTQEILASEVQLEKEKEKLLLDVQKVENARLELNGVIENSVQEESGEKQRLIEERQELMQELDELLAAVRQKESQIAERDSKIRELDAGISEKVSQFEHEKLNLETQISELTSSLQDLEKQSERINEKKKQIEAEVLYAEEAADKLLEVSKIAKEEAQKLQDALTVRKTVAKHALSSKEKRLSLASEEKQHIEVAHELQNKAASLRTTFQELVSEKAKMQQEAFSAIQHMSTIDRRLPEIEAEKRMAAGSRNFKEAGRLAAEAKGLLSTKESLMAESKKLTENLQALEQELESHAKHLTDLEREIQLKEGEAAKARYERLKLLATAARDERDAASELEDFEEAKSLDMEAEAADKEADELQKQYGFDAVTS
ncbi:hypothetical protein KP509_02G057100 [Ceratopteris richardii]|uniref:Uncharacterized protein n=1 Tax=Ceratopteris richardii TaxID=49495 RepID=A0A8T2V636_CERRI|nr:hypothetical protein KP509_02G057100 [Ceratopteris richardii]